MQRAGAFDRDSRVVLVLAGYGRDERTGDYLQALKDKAARDAVDMIHIEDFVAHEREHTNGKKIYSLWDTEVFADLVTYPSLWEGWGNQFLEALRGRVPVVLFEYPVYRQDIGTKGFQVISLGEEIQKYDKYGLVNVQDEIMESAADEALALLTNAKARQDVVEHNFNLGQKYFSMKALREHLGDLLS